MRVIVTGSRSWADRDLVWENLDKWKAVCLLGEDLTVVHGHCPTGADRFADEWCKDALHAWHEGRYPIRPVVERHPADWPNCGRLCPDDGGKHRRTRNGASYCPLAGHARNQDMADAGADVCLAFPTASSRGTFDMMRRAEAAGIVVINLGGARS